MLTRDLALRGRNVAFVFVLLRLRGWRWQFVQQLQILSQRTIAGGTVALNVCHAPLRGELTSRVLDAGLFDLQCLTVPPVLDDDGGVFVNSKGGLRVRGQWFAMEEACRRLVPDGPC